MSEPFGRKTDKSLCRLFFYVIESPTGQDCTAEKGERSLEVENACTYMFPGPEKTTLILTKFRQCVIIIYRNK